MQRSPGGAVLADTLPEGVMEDREKGKYQMPDFEKLRDRMVDRQLKPRGIQNAAVLQAMRAVPRHEFVPEEMKAYAYEDSPLPIGEEQTISQPYIVALMTQLLEPAEGDRVLEIGTGSGYAAAVLGLVVRTVYTIERHRSLMQAAAERFSALGYDNIHVFQGDGTLGLNEHAPYDAILVTAGAPEVPGTLKAQLAVGGRLLVPTGRSRRSQQLVRVRRLSRSDYRREALSQVRFVPLVGKAGWDGA
jgi:protein-L-isoaspartate(D-aspartate) O-methyltransferase